MYVQHRLYFPSLPFHLPTITCQLYNATYDMTSSTANNSNDVRLDLGTGPSTPSLQASIRIRPISIRFTEPGVRDLHLNLHSISYLRSIASPHAPEALLIFDFDTEQHHSPSRLDDTDQLERHVIDSLAAHDLMGDESVRMLKAKLETWREGVKGRRLRLIHAGRILMDGVKLVAYLDEVDARTRMQSRQSLRQIAMNDGKDQSDEDSEEEGVQSGAGKKDEQNAQERDTVEKKDMTVREMVDWLACSTDETSSVEGSGKGKGKNREPAYYADIVRVTIRTAPTVYIQCSVGELAPASSFSTPTQPLPDTSLAPSDADADADTHRGFNRLLSAGLSPSEISSIRSQFRTSHPVSTPYDLISAHEHTQHLLEMEESWMDTFAANPSNIQTDEAGTYSIVMAGLMVGFFFPLIPLFWFRDKPHPSSLPTTETHGDDDQDDELEWHNERTALTRDSVFGSTMQISILCGLMANLGMGVFRLIW